MLDQLKSKKIEVSISKGDTPKECVLKSIENLGGISKFVNEGPPMIIKFPPTEVILFNPFRFIIAAL